MDKLHVRIIILKGSGVRKVDRSKKGFIIGIDEVGRGALAGPLLVAAVIIPRGLRLKRKGLVKLRDSKHLSAKQRSEWLKVLTEHPRVSYAVSRTSPRVIDRKNVAKAANFAATRAYERLIMNHGRVIAKVYLDGSLYLRVNPRSNPRLSASTITRGDEKINAIKLASIVAKVRRDRYMVKLHKKNPEYFFDEHKGYGTKKHKRAIRKHGPSEFHRLTFI